MELVVDLHPLDDTVLILLLLVHALLRHMRRVLESCREAPHEPARMPRHLRLELHVLQLLVGKLARPKAELLVKIRLLSSGERLVIVDLFICDILEVLVVETIQNLLVVVGLVDDLHVDHRRLGCLPSALHLWAVLPWRLRALLERLVDASLSCPVILFVFHELGCILALEIWAMSGSLYLRRLLN